MRVPLDRSYRVKLRQIWYQSRKIREQGIQQINHLAVDVQRPVATYELEFAQEYETVSLFHLDLQLRTDF
jgi:hypothetical protein